MPNQPGGAVRPKPTLLCETELTNETEKGGRTLLHNAHAHSHHITNTKMSRFFLCNCSSTHTLRGEHLPPVDRKTHKWHNIFNIFSILLCPGVSLLERCSKMVLGVSQVVANALEIVKYGALRDGLPHTWGAYPPGACPQRARLACARRPRKPRMRARHATAPEPCTGSATASRFFALTCE